MTTPLMVPDERPATISRGSIPKSLSGMPEDMLSVAARRRRWVGVLYAVGFFSRDLRVFPFRPGRRG